MTNKQELLYLSRADVERVALDMGTVICLLEKAFGEKGAARIEMPPKPGIHPRKDAFIHAMPAYIPALHAAGIKWVSGYPDNFKHGLPYISGLLILNDPDNGLPIAVMDCTWITACRTGAATALSAKYLARPESSVIGILACGVQGRANLEALAAVFKIKRVYAFDILPFQLTRFVEEMKAKFSFEIIAVDDPKKAVSESDLIVTSGPILKHPQPTIQKDWLKPGAFASAVDFDSYWTGAAFAQFDKISTDDHAQFQYYKKIGYFQATPEPYADLGEIVAGLKPGRENGNERTLAINLGLALDDMAVAPEIYRRAKIKKIGTMLPL